MKQFAKVAIIALFAAVLCTGCLSLKAFNQDDFDRLTAVETVQALS